MIVSQSNFQTPLQELHQTTAASLKRNISPRVPSDATISLSLDDYNDIFSIFDAREYSEASLSDDFLIECKKLIGETKIPVGKLKLGIPLAKRNVRDEAVIAKRLHVYFLSQAHIYEKETEKEKHIAWIMIAVGIVIGFTVSYVIYVGHLHAFLLSVLSVIGEPASWFLIWTGADKLVALYKSIQQHKNFYHKMARIKIVFYGE